MNKKIWWTIGILLVVATTLLILKKKEIIGKKEAVKVATEKIIRRTIIETVSASGKVYPEDERKVSSDVSGEVVVDLRYLALVRQVHPVAFKDVLHLQFKQRGVGEDVAAAAVDARVLVILQGAVQQPFDVAIRVGDCGRVHGVRSLWGEVIPHDARRGSDPTEMTGLARCGGLRRSTGPVRRPGGGGRRSGCQRRSRGR